jgi:hypothetical protein
MNAMQECLVSLDLERARAIWQAVNPHLKPITTDAEMLATLHLARTQNDAVDDRLRFYSHCWLMERGLPSMLPDHLKPAADRMYPRKQSAVGISVNSQSELFRPVLSHVRTAMEGAVNELYADGHAENIKLIRHRMFEARRDTLRKLLGIIRDG